MLLINSTSKKFAAILSYLYLALNSLVSILLTPFLLKYLGVEEYGLYQMIYSVGHYIMILDLGIATVMVRYVSEYQEKKDYDGMEKFAGMVAVLTFIICCVVLCVGEIVNYNLENIYTKLSTKDYIKAHWMFNLMIYQFIVTIIDNYLQGIINAYERFVFVKIMSLIKICAVFSLTIVFVHSGFGAVGIVMANAIVFTVLALFDLFYVIKMLRFHIQITHWNKTIITPVFGLMLAMLLQSVVGNVNSSVDKTILGIMCTPADVTIYSIAATIITLFNTIPTVLSGLFQPQVTRMVVKGTNGSQLTDLVIRVGRWQFILCAAFFCGLILFGMDFLNLWVGSRLSQEEMRFSLLIMFIILPFNMIPLIQTVCISILNAYDKRIYRSIILVLMSVLHIVITLIITKYWGPIGSPIGTAISFLVGYVIILNIYYARSLQLEIIRMFKEILNRSWLCVLISTILCAPLVLWQAYSWIGFISKGFIYVSLLFILFYIKGFNSEEKAIVDTFLLRLPIVGKLRKK